MEPRRSLRNASKPVAVKEEILEEETDETHSISQVVNSRATWASSRGGKKSTKKIPVPQNGRVKHEEESVEEGNEENQTTGLSEYEKQVLQNIEERKKMFQMLVSEARNDFVKVAAPLAVSKPSQRGLKRKTAERFGLFFHGPWVVELESFS